jgi:hypothetical protein
MYATKSLQSLPASRKHDAYPDILLLGRLFYKDVFYYKARLAGSNSRMVRNVSVIRISHALPPLQL